MAKECLECKLKDCNPNAKGCDLRKAKKAKKPELTGDQHTGIVIKLCPSCKKEKPATEFWKNRTRTDGLYAYCKECIKKKKKKYKYIDENWSEADEV